jgi:hypothetical protein
MREISVEEQKGMLRRSINYDLMALWTLENFNAQGAGLEGDVSWFISDIRHCRAHLWELKDFAI